MKNLWNCVNKDEFDLYFCSRSAGRTNSNDNWRFWMQCLWKWLTKNEIQWQLTKLKLGFAFCALLGTNLNEKVLKLNEKKCENGWENLYNEKEKKRESIFYRKISTIRKETQRSNNISTGRFRICRTGHLENISLFLY